ncbi:AAA family ATPase [Pseudomonas sp. SWRI81]|uniref:AAA family ATPase n=1 Tax=Pseudomonas sp. SWRI81 TaxID=2745505 RepID=UPI001644BDD6|nr:AAA family ATPase [Pseudomonas sp. SWRI81]MBC3271904.1 AAA family ATPase [Pseudomonas sp. SWRI81]
MNLEAIAKQLVEMNESIVLIFAFNGSGKTQLSVAYKNATKNPETKKHIGVYYNAFSEDLFVWDNDEENAGANINLNIRSSSLNKFHSFLYENESLIMDKLVAYSPKYRYKLNLYDNIESGIESVSFFIEGAEDTPIKVSRGEERIFVWCFFLALLDADGWADVQNAHVFIDDPVSSLDEHNIFVTADTLFQQIETHYEKKRIIITTHHIGLFSILANRLTKGEKSGRYKNLTGLRVLKRVGGELTLETPRRSVFLYHLHLLQVLEEARNEQLYTYHFALLRQLLENIASFLGTGRIGHTLTHIGVEDVDSVANVINTHSHKSVYYDQTEIMNSAEQEYFNDIFEKLTEKYQFVLHAR